MTAKDEVDILILPPNHDSENGEWSGHAVGKLGTRLGRRLRITRQINCPLES